MAVKDVNVDGINNYKGVGMSYQCGCPFLVPDTEEFDSFDINKSYPQIHQVDCEYAKEESS